MTILGIDPGTMRVGYGIIRTDTADAPLVAAGILKVSRTKGPGDMSGYLQDIQAGVRQLCTEHAPDLLAIEKLYFSKNRKTALAVAEARGVILLAARSAGVDILEYSPTEVKAGITGHGGADKKAVLKMVRLILRASDLAVIDDASDALALALLAARDVRARAPGAS